MNRRSLLKGAAGVAAIAATRPTLAADTATLRIAYLHGLAADAHLWTAELLGSFAAQGLEIETVQFVTGLEAYQALAGGSVDVVTTGAVISNFPARGQGKAFLINAEEFGTAQLWVHPDSGIKTVADLKGQKIATTRGTTAHYFLFRALQHNGLDPAQDIEIVHQQMGNAVTGFIAGAVPAVATWMPFDGTIEKSAPTAVKIADASQFADAAILNGWSARNELHASDPELLRRFVRAWLPANEALATRPQEILTALQPTRYREFTLAQLQSQYDACHWRSAAEWAARYRDGSVVKILDQVTAFNVAAGAFTDPLPAATYFDPSPLQDVLAQG